MSFAYNTNTAYDYRRYDEQEQCKAAQAPARRPVDRSVVMARRVMALMTAVIIAAACIGMLYVKAQVFMMQREVNGTKEEIREAKKLMSSLSEQYNEATNINTIMEKAGQLGMGYPSGDQILYVTVGGGTAASVEMKGN